MSFISQIRNIFGRPQRPPPVPPGFEANVPSEDPIEIIEPAMSAGEAMVGVPDNRLQDETDTNVDDAENLADDPLDAIESGTTIAIQYVDAKNEESRRVITIRKILAKPDGIIFQCYCHTRKAPRAFRADRITAIIDLVTGEVFDDPVGYFREFSPNLAALVLQARTISEAEKAHKRAMGLCRDGVRVLMYLAHADGVVVDDEMEIIAQYIDRCCQPKVPHYDLDRILVYAQRQYPDTSTVSACLRRLIQSDRIDLVLDYIKAICVADEVVTEEEARAVSEVCEVIGEIADGLAESGSYSFGAIAANH